MQNAGRDIGGNDGNASQSESLLNSRNLHSGRTALNTLREEDAPDFLHRFDSFNDSVIRRIEHQYCKQDGQRTSVIISARDVMAPKQWSNVTFTASHVSELTLREGRTTCVVISFGIVLKWIDGKVWCAFSPYFTEMESIDDFRRSEFYLVASSISVTINPYSEDET